jgi:hypothetical protein
VGSQGGRPEGGGVSGHARVQRQTADAVAQDLSTLASMIATIRRVPLTVFAIKGVPGKRREGIEAAVVAGTGHITAPHEARIAADPFDGGFRVLVTGSRGFERTVTFVIDDDPAVIAER